jgi:hypothetical protein
MGSGQRGRAAAVERNEDDTGDEISDDRVGEAIEEAQRGKCEIKGRG